MYPGLVSCPFYAIPIYPLKFIKFFIYLFIIGPVTEIFSLAVTESRDFSGCDHGVTAFFRRSQPSMGVTAPCNCIDCAGTGRSSRQTITSRMLSIMGRA